MQRVMQGVSRGALIVLEGIDRTGKTTQSKLLVDALAKSGVHAEARRFPARDTAIGTLINSYLKCEAQLNDHVIHLLYSANRWEARDDIVQTLQEGKTLIVDRYTFSGVAFSAAKGIDFDWCKDPDRGLPKPDLVIYLDLSVDDAKKRGDFGQERYEREDFQRRVHDMYDKLKDESSWATVAANRDISAIHKDLIQLASDVVKQVKSSNPPILPLWPTIK